MKFDESAAPAAASAEPVAKEPSLSQRSIIDILAITEMEIRKLRHDPTEMLTRAVQPLLWLLVFGQAFSRVRAFDTGGVNYLSFITPGILSQSVMFIAIFFGLSIIWEKDMGILQKFLAMPVPRYALVLGKALAAGVRTLIQAAVIFIVAALIGVPLRWHLFDLLSAAVVVIIGAMFFTTFSMGIAALVKTRERFMGIGQILTMPLFFASNALYPISILPDWLRFLALANPLSYMVDFMRGVLVTGQTVNSTVDLCVLTGACIISTAVASLLYPRVVV